MSIIINSSNNSKLIFHPINDAPIAYYFSKNVDENSEITFNEKPPPGSNTGTDNGGGSVF